MQRNILVIFMICFSFLACDSYDVTPVELKNGEKWEVNTSITTGVKNMQTLMANEELSMEQLEEQMLIEFNKIFKNCNAKGEMHIQLHNYFLPLKSKVEELSENSKDYKKEVKDYLADYYIYFKS